MKSIGRHIELIGCIQFNEITSLNFPFIILRNKYLHALQIGNIPTNSV